MIDQRSPPALPIRRVIAVAALAILWLEMLSFGTSGLDAAVGRTFYAGGHPAEIAIAKGFTFPGTWQFGIPVVVAGIALLAWLGRKRAAVAAFLVIAVGRVLLEVQKHAVGRARPAIEAHLVPVSTASFPSGHAGNSMIVCLTFAILFFGRTRWWLAALAVAFVIALCVGASRVMLGVHWPSDVIGGWAFGLLWVLAALPWAQRVAHVRGKW